MGAEYDENGDPTEDAIEKLLAFDGTPRELIDYIGELWSLGPGTLKAKFSPGSWQRDYFRWRIATGGESYNETIVGHLENTMFWFRYWESIHRGGGYTFHIAQEEMDNPTFLGDLKHYEARRETAAADHVQGS